MKFSRIIVICFFLALSLTLTELRAEDKVSIEFERFSDRVLIVRAGKVLYDQSIAIASEKGIVVIDTGTAPSLTAEYRKIIEREFGRNDFSYVINTHFHYDHTAGNQVFPEAEIIAHELTPNLMRRFNEGIQNFIASRRAIGVQWENRLKTLEPNSVEAQRLRDLLSRDSIMIDDLENNYVLTLPTITFSDRMTLDLGDLRLKLIYFGEGLHAGDDIIIHCPEEKLLFTGSLFFPGSMRVAFSAQFDAPRWIEVLNDVLKDMNQVDWAYHAHSGGMPGKFIALWRDYLVDLLESLSAAKEEGLNFEAAQERFSYDKKFAYLEQSGLEAEQLRRDHQQNLPFVWRRVLEMQSAATVLEETLSESGVEAALKKYQEMYSNQTEKHYFDEAEFNRLGYRLLQGNRISEAIEIFKLNVKMYPDSSNVYDSLGEAYMNAGETELAIKNYQKSLEINPQNTNAVNILKRIKKEQ